MSELLQSVEYAVALFKKACPSAKVTLETVNPQGAAECYLISVFKFITPEDERLLDDYFVSDIQSYLWMVRNLEMTAALLTREEGTE